MAQAFVKNIAATYIGRQTDCHGDILNPPSPGLMRRENNSVMSSTKNEAVVNHVKAQKTVALQKICWDKKILNVTSIQAATLKRSATNLTCPRMSPFLIPSTCPFRIMLSGKAMMLSPPPLRTRRASFPAARSGLLNALDGGRGTAARALRSFDLRVQLPMTIWMHQGQVGH